MKTGGWKAKAAYGTLLLLALLKVTLVPNLQGAALYQPMKSAITSLGWVLAVYLAYWYSRKKRWEKATPEQRRDMERAETDERNQFLWGQAAYYSWQVMLFALAAAGVVMSMLDCTPGMLAVAALFGVQVLSYFGKLRVLNRKF